MTTKEIAQRVQEIQEILIGFEPGVGYSQLPGPSDGVRLARTWLFLEGLRSELVWQTEREEKANS